ISSLSRSSGRGPDRADFKSFEWPLTADINFVVNADGTASQTTTIQQAYNKGEVSTVNGTPVAFSVLSDEAAPTSTLLFTSAGTSLTGQSSSQKYFSFDSSGTCYSREIAASGGALSSVTDGAGCQDSQAHR